MNPDLNPAAFRPPALSLDDYLHGIRSDNRVILSRAITLVESSLPRHAELAQQLVERCLPYAGNSLRLGITGPPGVGKSTFIEALGIYLVQELRHKVAVLAVDPTSHRSRGSILGDKTRMARLAAHPSAFIRPSPAGGSLGGVARRTREAMLVCEAAGFDVLLVETVGVGQSEVAVHSMVDFFLLLLLAGAGDELQGIKRGIMEMVDLAVINKADGPNRRRAEQARREFASALHFFPPAESGWTPQVVTCSALTGEGISAIWDIVLRYRQQMQASGWFASRRRAQAVAWMREAIQSSLQEEFAATPSVAALLPALERRVWEGSLSPFRAARTLLEAFRRGGAPAPDLPACHPADFGSSGR